MTTSPSTGTQNNPTDAGFITGHLPDGTPCLVTDWASIWDDDSPGHAALVRADAERWAVFIGFPPDCATAKAALASITHLYRSPGVDTADANQARRAAKAAAKGYRAPLDWIAEN
ncbi:hypothetical protein [Arthrobacter wenxiniae]|uniref:Uncharacterized protein n=1 Tax=Arthrobacter wenxiniae TaxID=2713570 RepID=A0A7Y7LZI0_9MICC|nr:hypothetical protein [Arthrobacter wenxiniae]NVM94763.1 hypothetical protein [Arthrobacter wenxiniae]